MLHTVYLMTVSNSWHEPCRPWMNPSVRLFATNSSVHSSMDSSGLLACMQQFIHAFSFFVHLFL